MDESQNDGAAAGLSRGRRMLVLGICCMSLFVVGLDTTIVNVALPTIRSSTRRVACRSCSGRRRLHAGGGQPADPRRLDRRPDRPQARLQARAGAVHARLAAVRARAEPRAADRVARLQAIGGSMLNPVAMSIIRNVFTDAARARAGDRHLGRRGRHQHGARPGARRRAGGRPSAGARSSGSTSRSGSPRSCSTARCRRPSRGRPARGASTRSARCW